MDCIQLFQRLLNFKFFKKNLAPLGLHRKVEFTRCGRKVMRLAMLCMNRQSCCLPSHGSSGNPCRRLSTSLNLLQLLHDCWERLKWRCVCEVGYENGLAKKSCATKFCVKLGKSATVTYEKLQRAYGEYGWALERWARNYANFRRICSVFNTPGDKLTATSAIEHYIPTPTIPANRAITLRNYQIPEHHQHQARDLGTCQFVL